MHCALFKIWLQVLNLYIGICQFRKYYNISCLISCLIDIQRTNVWESVSTGPYNETRFKEINFLILSYAVRTKYANLENIIIRFLMSNDVIFHFLHLVWKMSKKLGVLFQIWQLLNTKLFQFKKWYWHRSLRWCCCKEVIVSDANCR